jgi:cell division protease FtsH
LALMVLVNASLQPSLGDQVTADEFLGNLKGNRYSRVEIRNDGNAVAFGKYVNLVQFQDSPALDLPQGSGTQVKTAEGMEEKELNDVVNLFKAPASLQEALENLRDSFSGNRVREIYILEDQLLIDWENKDSKDWLITGVDEDGVVATFNANGLDFATLPVKISYLRSAGSMEQVGDFETALKNNNYANVWVLNGKLYARVAASAQVQNYVNFGTGTPDFTKFLQEEGINLASRTVTFNFLPINQVDYVMIINLVFIAMLGVLGFMLLRSINGGNNGLMKFGQSKARMFFGQKMEIDFGDVAGVDEAKEELKEVVDFLKNPTKYQKLGAKIPRGILMVGEPGTGKTLLARAVAGEAEVPFFHTSGSEFEEMLVGAGASRVRDLFDKAKKASPALIFIDEIDAVGRKRGTTIQSSSTEQTLNQILVEMDGFEPRDNIIVIAATNRPDVLDPALLRPGRFDRKVVLDAPDIEGRKAILEIHAANKPLAAEVDLLKVAKRTVGFSGADLANMLNEAAIIVAKQDRSEITMHDIEEAATKVQSGPIRKRKRTEEELKMTAYHEAAHAVVMKFTPQSDPVHRITILSRGMALGYTMPLPETDQLQMTKTKMESKIRSLLAGWAAEEMVFGDVTTGASNDIDRATSIANKMVKQFGMSKQLGLVKYGSEEEPHLGWGQPDKGYSESTAEMIDDEVRRIIREAYDEAKAILNKQRKLLDKISEVLLAKEVLERDEFDQMVEELGEK